MAFESGPDCCGPTHFWISCPRVLRKESDHLRPAEHADTQTQCAQDRGNELLDDRREIFAVARRAQPIDQFPARLRQRFELPASTRSVSS
jgi:hypothetical protein